MLRSRPIYAVVFATSMAVSCAQRPQDESSQEAAGQIDESQAITMRSPKVSPAAHHDSSPPLFLIPAADSAPRADYEPKRLPARRSGRFASLPTIEVQTSVSPLAAPTTLLNFDGVGAGFTGPAGSFSVKYAPPDTNGDVGPNHYVQLVNTDFAVFDKTGKALYGPVPTNTLWAGFTGGCQDNNDGDGTVVYDTMADRWVISQFSVTTTPYLQCVAVSQTGDPTGAWNRYSFDYGSSNFNDYPKIGIWPDAYYTTFNIFAGGSIFSGAQVCAYDRAKMLANQAATQQCFSTDSSWGGVLPAGMTGSRQPPAGAPEYLISFGANDLGVWKFHVDWTTPSNSTFAGPTLVAVAPFADACNDGTCIPQSGTSQQLDSLADRLMYRLSYRNFGDHEAMVVNHSITAGSSVGVRWYELRLDSSRNVSVFQQGTYAPDSGYRWMGSLAQDQQGNIALGFSLSSSSLHPEVHYTGRLATDPAGQMTQGEGSIIAGSGSQIGGSTHTPTLTRWGDYSMMSIDPDGCTFWYTTEYIPSNGAFNWATRIGSFKFPTCGATTSNDFSIGANPGTLSLNQGASGTSTISTTVTSGSAQAVAFSVSGLPSGATASFSPVSVSAGKSSTLTVNAGTAQAGSYALTITGTGASATHTTSLSLAVSGPPPANDFSIGASPASVSVDQGGSATSTISTTVTSGSAESLSLSAGGLPSGASASLSPTSITAGGSSTLTIDTGTAAAGNYTVTVTAAGASATHSASVALSINALTTAITAPADGSTVSATVTVSASASSAATKIELYADGVLFATGSSSPFSAAWDTTKVADGAHALTSKAYDASSNTATSTAVNVTVSNGGTQCPPGTVNVGGTCVPTGTGCSTRSGGAAGLLAALFAALALCRRRRA